MDPCIIIGLVEYIQLLHKGNLDKSLYTCFETDLKSCSAQEVNIAIENLLIRYNDIETIENTVAKFLRATALGLERRQKAEYPPNSIFYILDQENRSIETMLEILKRNYLLSLPNLKENHQESKNQFKKELQKIETVKKHYLKLQYGLFSALEAQGAPTKCIQLMWHLEDSIWPSLKDCLDMLSGDDWDFNHFNKTYGPLFFLLGTLVFREDRVLFPVAYDYLPEAIQRALILDAKSYGILKVDQ